MFHMNPEFRSITSICVVEDITKCPLGYTPVSPRFFLTLAIISVFCHLFFLVFRSYGHMTRKLMQIYGKMGSLGVV